jgi:hypothetical protein
MCGRSSDESVAQFCLLLFSNLGFKRNWNLMCFEMAITMSLKALCCCYLGYVSLLKTACGCSTWCIVSKACHHVIEGDNCMLVSSAMVCKVIRFPQKLCTCTRLREVYHRSPSLLRMCLARKLYARIWLHIMTVSWLWANIMTGSSLSLLETQQNLRMQIL